jgi:hypothetical protein
MILTHWRQVVTEDCKTGFLQKTLYEILLPRSGAYDGSTPPDQVKPHQLDLPITFEDRGRSYERLHTIRGPGRTDGPGVVIQIRLVL